ncbi:MAG: M23 family metallopeptidase [Candidatus Omnitrophica bacterium]|nr:M23 family metallopeptidase [Candidatus Omnitrophota bacterium]
MARILKKRKLFKGICVMSVGLIFFSYLPAPAFAARSRAGGGDLAKFDTSAFLTGAALQVGSAVIGAGIGGAWSSAAQSAQSATEVGRAAHNIGTVGKLLSDGSHLANGFKSLTFSSALANVGRGLSTYTATSQIGRAVGNYGVYKGWSPKKIYTVSTITGAATAGFLNPGVSLGGALSPSINVPAVEAATLPIMLKGAAVGALSGAARAAVITSMDGNRINKGKGPGTTSQILGMVAGNAVTNFGRGLFDKKTYHQQIDSQWQQADAASVPDADKFTNLKVRTVDKLADAGGASPFEEKTYWKEIKGISKDGVIETGKVVPDSQLGQVKNGDNIVPVYREGTRRLTLYDINANVDGNQVAYRLFVKAPFIDTFSRQSWPGLASEAVGIIAENKLSKKNKMYAPLIQSLSGTVFSSLANSYGIGADMYFGKKQDKLQAKLDFAEEFFVTRVTQQMIPFNKEAGKAQQHNQLGTLYTHSIDPNTPYPDTLEKMDSVIMQGVEDLPFQYQQGQAERLKAMDRQGDESIARRNRYIELERQRVEEAFRAQPTHGRSSVFAKDLSFKLPSVLFQNAVSMGTQAVMNSLVSDKDSATKQMLVPFGANMLTATIRGIAWHKGWDSASKQWQWESLLENYAPEQYTITPSDKDYNWLSASMDRAYYPSQKAEYERFNTLYGVTPVKIMKVRTTDINEGAHTKNDIVEWVPVSIVEADNTAPTTKEAIGESIKQAALDSFVETMSFGRPMVRTSLPDPLGGIRPEQVSAQDFISYQRTLEGLSSMPFDKAMVAQVASGQRSAMAKNIRGTLLQIPGVATAFHMQPERLVKVHTRVEKVIPYEVNIPFGEATDRLEVNEDGSYTLIGNSVGKIQEIGEENSVSRPSGEKPFEVAFEGQMAMGEKGVATITMENGRSLQVPYVAMKQSDTRPGEGVNKIDPTVQIYFDFAGTQDFNPDGGNMVDHYQVVLASKKGSAEKTVLASNLPMELNKGTIELRRAEGVAAFTGNKHEYYNSPLNKFVIQQLRGREGGLPNVSSVFRLPMPDIMYDTRPQTVPIGYLRNTNVNAMNAAPASPSPINTVFPRTLAGSGLTTGQYDLNFLVPRENPVEPYSGTTEDQRQLAVLTPNVFLLNKATLTFWNNFDNKLKSPFGMRSTGFHGGADAAYPKGTPIPLLTKSLTVTEVGSQSVRGNYLFGIDENGVEQRFLHMERKPDFKPGDVLSHGEEIGTVGNTGRVRGITGVHLHWETRGNGKTFDPLVYRDRVIQKIISNNNVQSNIK